MLETIVFSRLAYLFGTEKYSEFIRHDMKPKCCCLLGSEPELMNLDKENIRTVLLYSICVDYDCFLLNSLFFRVTLH